MLSIEIYYGSSGMKGEYILVCIATNVLLLVFAFLPPDGFGDMLGEQHTVDKLY